jgi:hypothetical protein
VSCGAFGFVVHSAGAVVMGEDLSEVAGGGVGVAAAQGVDVGGGRGCGVLVVGFAGDVLVDGGFVGLASAGYRVFVPLLGYAERR